MMTIRVETYLRAQPSGGKPYLEMKAEEGSTLKGLLLQLAEAHGPDLGEVFVDGTTGEIKPHYLVLINGRRISQSENADKLLADGDVISIIRPFSGG